MGGMMSDPKYPNVKIKIVGLPADKLSIVDTTTLALRKANVSEPEINVYQEEALAGDFDNCLAVTLATVDCFDDGIDLFPARRAWILERVCERLVGDSDFMGTCPRPVFD
jgi:hypothetical protein